MHRPDGKRTEHSSERNLQDTTCQEDKCFKPDGIRGDKVPLRRIGVPFQDNYSSTNNNKGVPLRRIVRRHISHDVWTKATHTKSTRQGVQEECRYVGNIVNSQETKKVYQMHGLSLYCEAEFMNLTLSCLTDCGAGVNLISKRVIGRLLENTGQHIVNSISLRNKSLTVSVANEDKWQLNQVATITFRVGGEPFTQDFWITDNIKEDVFFGIPALRAMSASINVAETPESGDT